MVPTTGRVPWWPQAIIEVRTFQDELYITSSVNNEVSTVGMSTTVNDAVACIKMTRTKTLATPAPVTPVPVTPTMDIMDDNVLTLGIVDAASPRGARGGTHDGHHRRQRADIRDC